VEDAAWALGGSLGDREHVLAVARARWPARRVDVASTCATWLGWVAEIPRSDIATVPLPFVGDSRWRTVRIDRTSGWSTQLQIDRHSAGGFVAALA
jgi:hypothetical protein